MVELSSHINSLFNSISYRFGGVLVDPGDEWEGFENVEAILLTHAHFDHIYGLNRIIELNSDVKIITNIQGMEMLLSDKLNMSRYHEKPFVCQSQENFFVVKDNEYIDICSNVTAKAVFTPGHNPSCITWIIDDCIFTGDSYIPGIKTVTNLPGGNKEQAAQSEELIKQLAVGRRIFPGHKVEL